MHTPQNSDSSKSGVYQYLRMFSGGGWNLSIAVQITENCFEQSALESHIDNEFGLGLTLVDVFQMMLLFSTSDIKLISYTFFLLLHVADWVIFVMGAEWHFIWPNRDQHLNSSLPIGSVWGTSILEAWLISYQNRSIVSFPKSVHYFPGRCPAPLEAVSLLTLGVWWDESHPLSFTACLHCTLQSYL